MKDQRSKNSGHSSVSPNPGTSAVPPSRRSMGLTSKMILSILGVLALILVVNFFVFARGYRASIQQEMVQKAAAFTTLADEVKSLVSRGHEQKAFDTTGLRGELQEILKRGGSYRESRFYQVIPVVSAWTSAANAAKTEKLEFKIVALEPRNPEHKLDSGSFRLKMLQDLTDQVKSGGSTLLARVDPSTNTLRTMRALRLSADCLMCHGQAGSAGDINKDGKDAVGFRMEGWKSGDLHGAFELTFPLEIMDSQVRGFLLHSLAWSLPLAFLAAFLCYQLVNRLVGQPVQALLARFGEAAQGNLAVRMDASRDDELGKLAQGFNGFLDNLRRMIGDIAAEAVTLTSSSTELTSISRQMAEGVQDMSDRAQTVSAAAEEASANTASVVTGMDQATSNLATVASATEEMSATVGDIASNTEKARAISTEATQQAQVVSTTMNELGHAAQEIGHVTETITSISAQTNLLALNATIEAARAGVAGKGFAVVANEIKELAQQTAAATEDIKSKISGIQASTGGAIGDIEKIAQIINDVQEIVATIAAAIEEQSVVTRDVASNIAQASMSVRDSNDRVAQTAEVSQAIARDIAQVNATIGEIRHNGQQVQTRAGELSNLAEQLNQMVGRFRIQ